MLACGQVKSHPEQNHRPAGDFAFLPRGLLRKLLLRPDAARFSVQRQRPETAVRTWCGSEQLRDAQRCRYWPVRRLSARQHRYAACRTGDSCVACVLTGVLCRLRQHGTEERIRAGLRFAGLQWTGEFLFQCVFSERRSGWRQQRYDHEQTKRLSYVGPAGQRSAGSAAAFLSCWRCCWQRLEGWCGDGWSTRPRQPRPVRIRGAPRPVPHCWAR